MTVMIDLTQDTPLSTSNNTPFLTPRNTPPFSPSMGQASIDLPFRPLDSTLFAKLEITLSAAKIDESFHESKRIHQKENIVSIVRLFNLLN